MDDEMMKMASGLFRVFAQFEYTQKTMGYCLARACGDAKPDWQRFARELTTPLAEIDDPSVTEAVTYILEHPPRKPIYVAGALQWNDAVPQTNDDNDRILQYVRRVRNNLFHGGKFNGHFFDPQRNHQLLDHSIKILLACILMSPRMLEAYENRAA